MVNDSKKGVSSRQKGTDKNSETAIAHVRPEQVQNKQNLRLEKEKLFVIYLTYERENKFFP